MALGWWCIHCVFDPLTHFDALTALKWHAGYDCSADDAHAHVCGGCNACLGAAGKAECQRSVTTQPGAFLQGLELL